jgi:hypothetical protein
VEALHCLFVDQGCTEFRPVVNKVIRRIDADDFLYALVRLHLDSGGIADAEHNGHTIGLLVVEDGQYSFPG